MEFLPSFLATPFLWAGLACAAGPILIHLLNRRRFHVVQWAAMDFLREALQRNRRILQIRDLLLLLLRTAAVLLIGVALAQPFFARNDEAFDGSKPLHAVLLVDNSMSMGYRSLEGSLLDQARLRAKQYVEKLPADSRVSVIPLGGSRFGYSPDAYTKEHALEALDRVELVDRSASVQQAVNEAQKAAHSGPTLGKRVVLFGDQQAVNWHDIIGPEQFADLPSFQVVDVSAPDRENTWISDLRIQDGLADVETPTTFLVELRHEGPTPRENLQVTLYVDDVEVGSKTVTLEPGLGAREVAFEYVFSGYRPEPDRPVAVPVRAAITPDRLTVDDQRNLVVHVVAALPVIFVDQYGDGEEDPVRHRLGETRHLRRLLAPVTSRQETLRQLVKIRHLKLDQLDRESLADARLVVIAGVADPGAHVELLREYVLQGGQLVIAAGGDYDPAINAGFDPDKWMDAAWLGGNGILPVPLKPGFLGATPREQGREIKPFFLSFDSLQSHAYFKLAGVGDDELRDLYAEPFFFKATQPDVSADAVQTLLAAEALRLDEEARIVAAAAHHAKPAGGQEPKTQGSNGQGAAEQSRAADDQSRLAHIRPSWLVWNNSGTAAADDELPAEDAARQRRVTELAERTRPRVLARFNDAAETPFLVERQVGRGNVLLVTTGLLSDWNTLPKTNAMLIFDRVLRAMVEATLPARNFPPQERLALALPAAAVRDATVILRRPGDDTSREALDVGYVGRDQLGVTIPRPLTRGLYRVVATRPVPNGGQPTEETVWETPLAINGTAAESELTPLARDDFEARVGNARVRWVGPDEEISLAGSQIRGQASWWWVILAVLGLLVLELLLLSAPMWRSSRVTLQQA